MSRDAVNFYTHLYIAIKINVIYIFNCWPFILNLNNYLLFHWNSFLPNSMLRRREALRERRHHIVQLY